MKQLDNPNCPRCNDRMSPAGGIIGEDTKTIYWTCYKCKENIEDLEND